MDKMTKNEQPADIRNAGVFTGNRNKPIHRWYPYIEGYSADLVEWALNFSPTKKPRILDPFGGSGTTNLVAAERNLDSSFCEVNPFMAWMADTKINVSQKVQDRRDLEGLVEFQKFMRSTRRIPNKDLAYTTIVAADEKRNYFPAGVAREIAASLTWIDQNLHEPIRQLARVAVAVSLVPSSSMVRRTDLRRRTPSDTKPQAFRDCVIRSIEMILNDLNEDRPQWNGTASLVAPDIRTLESQEDLYDLIVTSPPYLNGTNYCRNTKLELLSLEFISSESGLSQFRTESITAGINSVSKQRNTPTKFEHVESIARKLDECAYDKRLPHLVRLYFSDMTEALIRLRLSSTHNAQLVLDIGDSKFSGVHVPTDKLLITCAKKAGWEVEESFPVRKRRSFDGTELQQVVIRFSAAAISEVVIGSKSE